MAQKLYEESNIQAIANAIRGKNGLSNTYKTSEMAAAISAIQTGGAVEPLDITSNGTYTAPEGIDGYSPITVNVPQDGSPPDSDFVLTGSLDYRFAGGGREWTLQTYGNRYTTSKIDRCPYMFENSDATIIPFEFNFIDGGAYCEHMFNNGKKLKKIPSIDFKQTKARDAAYMFSHCEEVEEIGTLKNLYPTSIQEMFRYCYKLRHLPNIEGWNWDSVHSGSQGGDIFSSSYSLREIPTDFLKEMYTKETSSYYSHFLYYGFRYLYALDELNGIVPYGSNYDSNFISASFDNCSHIKNLTFALQDDGTPYIKTWRNQTIDLTKYVGYASSSIYITNYNSGITVDKKVTDDATYQALKNDPDWFASDINYSRYNHDSAVATINSLPDTSTYVASAGGTNTIKFKGASGSATDGGAINTLTEEEIAVATAKGWTVSLV